MKFTVVVPSYNQGSYIEDCIRSVLLQRGDVDVELIVIDGGSDDETLKVLGRYDSDIDYWVSEPDDGQSDAINKGFEKATGDVFCWLNSDDYFYAGALKKVGEIFQENKTVDFIFGDMAWVDLNKKLINIQSGTRFNIDELVWGYCYIPQPSSFWRGSVYQSVGGVKTDIVCAMDYEYWVRIYLAGFNFKYVNQVFSGMRSYPEQKNKRLRDVSNKEDMAIRELYLGRAVTSLEYWVKAVFYRGRRKLLKTLGA